MSKPIEINFVYTKELAIKASKLFYDYDMKNSSKRYIGWLFVALMQFGVVGALKHDSFGLLFVSTFLVIYWYYIRWYVRKGMIVKFYDKSNINNRDVLFILDKSGLHYEEEVIAWDNVVKVIKFDDGALVQTDSNSLFFHRDFFCSFDDMQSFLSQMKEHGKI